MEGERKQRPSDVGCRVPRIWGREQDVFLPRSHRALNVLRENKQRPSDVRCRVPRISGKEQDVSFFRSNGALNAWKENSNCTPLTSAAGCLEFGAGKKTSICLGHMGLLTCEKRPNDAPLTSTSGGRRVFAWVAWVS